MYDKVGYQSTYLMMSAVVMVITLVAVFFLEREKKVNPVEEAAGGPVKRVTESQA